MAKVYYSGLVNYIKGRLGDFIYSKHLSTPYIKYQPPSQYNPNSARQQQIKANFGYFSDLWDSLSDSYRNLWSVYAAHLRHRISGMNSFISLNSALLNASHVDLTFNYLPPPTPETPAFVRGFCAYNVSDSRFYFSWLSPLLSCVYVTSQFRFHYNFCRNFPSYGLCSTVGYRPSWRFIGTCCSSYGSFLFPHDFPSGAELFFRSHSIELYGRKSPHTGAIPITSEYFLHFYIADTDNMRIMKFLKSDRSFLSKIGSGGSGPDEFLNPMGITRLSDHLFVSEMTGSRVTRRLRSDLSYINESDGTPPPADEFGVCSGIIADELYLYIMSLEKYGIWKRKLSDFSAVQFTGSSGNGAGQFSSPYGICVDHCRIYVADTGNDRIQVFNKSDLSFVYQFGSLGNDQYKFDFPCGVAVDLLYLYVSDGGNGRVVKYLKSDFSYVSEYGSLGSGQDQLAYNWGIAVDYDNLYIADAENCRVMIRRKSDFAYVDSFGSLGSGDYQFQYPRGICLDDNYYQLFNQ